MSDAPLFPPRLLAALVGLVTLVFAVSLLLTGGGESEGEIWGANSWSRSAIGGRALYDTLAETGRSVARWRADAARVDDDGVLVLDEPSQSVFGDAFRAKLKSAKRILLILPKREGVPDRDHEGWIADSTPIAVTLPEAALFPLDSAAKIDRAPPPTRFDVDALGFAPTLVEPAQFAKSTVMKPIIALGDEILVGEIDDQDRRIFVLADPDPLENHGLAKPNNTAFALALFDRIGAGKAKFVFDETIHGFVSTAGTFGGSPALRMLRFPGDLILAEAAAAVLLLVAASVGRFGPLLPAPRAFNYGKRALVANIAALIDFGGHHAETLRRYVEAMAAEGAAQLRPPAGLAKAQRDEWVDHAASARGAKRAISEILMAARSASDRDLAALLVAAQAVRQWRREIGHGAG